MMRSDSLKYMTKQPPNFLDISIWTFSQEMENTRIRFVEGKNNGNSKEITSIY